MWLGLLISCYTRTPSRYSALVLYWDFSLLFHINTLSEVIKNTHKNIGLGLVGVIFFRGMYILG